MAVLLGIGAYSLWYMYIDWPIQVLFGALCWFLLLSYQTGGKYWHKLSGFELQNCAPDQPYHLDTFYMLVFALILLKTAALHWEALQNWAGVLSLFWLVYGAGEVCNLAGTGSMFEIFLGFGDEESSRARQTG